MYFVLHIESPLSSIEITIDAGIESPSWVPSYRITPELSQPFKEMEYKKQKSGIVNKNLGDPISGHSEQRHKKSPSLVVS